MEQNCEAILRGAFDWGDGDPEHFRHQIFRREEFFDLVAAYDATGHELTIVREDVMDTLLKWWADPVYPTRFERDDVI